MYGLVTPVELVLNLDGRGVFARRPDGNLTFFTCVNATRSSCRACEAAFGGAAVVNPADVVCLMHREFWFYDCCAAERSLASSTAATKKRVAAIDAPESMLKNVILKKILHIICSLMDYLLNPCQAARSCHCVGRSAGHASGAHLYIAARRLRFVGVEQAVASLRSTP